MKQIRNNIFETNSSSVHAISISSEPYTLPTHRLSLYFGAYGWSYDDLLDTPQERLSYLYTYIFCLDREVAIYYIRKLFNWFDEDNIQFVIEDHPLYDPYNDYFYLDYKHVDHQSVDIETLKKLFETKDTLYRFLFSDGSAVCIDNDNGDMEAVNNFMKNYKNAFYC